MEEWWSWSFVLRDVAPAVVATVVVYVWSYLDATREFGRQTFGLRRKDLEHEYAPAQDSLIAQVFHRADRLIHIWPAAWVLGCGGLAAAGEVSGGAIRKVTSGLVPNAITTIVEQGVPPDLGCGAISAFFLFLLIRLPSVVDLSPRDVKTAHDIRRDAYLDSLLVRIVSTYNELKRQFVGRCLLTSGGINGALSHDRGDDFAVECSKHLIDVTRDIAFQRLVTSGVDYDESRTVAKREADEALRRVEDGLHIRPKSAAAFPLRCLESDLHFERRNVLRNAMLRTSFGDVLDLITHTIVHRGPRHYRRVEERRWFDDHVECRSLISTRRYDARLRRVGVRRSTTDPALEMLASLELEFAEDIPPAYDVLSVDDREALGFGEPRKFRVGLRRSDTSPIDAHWDRFAVPLENIDIAAK